MLRPLSSVLVGGALAGAVSAAYGGDIQWTECDEAFTNMSTVPIECGFLNVPKDYEDTSSNSSTIELKMLRVPALKQPADGTIIAHFGGPGPDGREGVAALGGIMQVYVKTAKAYQSSMNKELTLQQSHRPDLRSCQLGAAVSRHPASHPTESPSNLETRNRAKANIRARGTGSTLNFNCYNETEAPFRPGNRGNNAVKADDRISVGRNWALAGAEADACSNYGAQHDGDLVGTAYTARDVMQMVDALEDDGLLRFWGISYGTVVGSTVAAMFPDRIERLLLDSVQNPQQFWHGNDYELSADTDKVFSAFLHHCFGMPDKCSLAAENSNSTAVEIERKVYDVVEKFRYRPVPILDGPFKGQLIDQALILQMIRSALYGPARYPSLANLLRLLIADDIEGFIPAYVEHQGGGPDIFNGGLPTDLPLTIFCLDKDYYDSVEDLEDIMPDLEQFGQTSRVAGDLLSWITHVCAQFDLRSKERYEGGFHDPIDTKEPVLFINGEYDVVTPYVSAKNLSSSFPGSSLVRFEGFGHGLVNHPSPCTAKAVMNYFQNGELPGEDAVCESASDPFDVKGWYNFWPELGAEDLIPEDFEG